MREAGKLAKQLANDFRATTARSFASSINYDRANADNATRTLLLLTETGHFDPSPAEIQQLASEYFGRGKLGPDAAARLIRLALLMNARLDRIQLDAATTLFDLADATTQKAILRSGQQSSGQVSIAPPQTPPLKSIDSRSFDRAVSHAAQLAKSLGSRPHTLDSFVTRALDEGNDLHSILQDAMLLQECEGFKIDEKGFARMMAAIGAEGGPSARETGMLLRIAMHAGVDASKIPLGSGKLLDEATSGARAVFETQRRIVRPAPAPAAKETAEKTPAPRITIKEAAPPSPPSPPPTSFVEGGETYPIDYGLDVQISKKNAALIKKLVTVTKPADDRDAQLLAAALDALPTVLLEALATGGYTITASRHSITNARDDIRGGMNRNGGESVLSDFAEGVHGNDAKGKPNITVRTYWRNGELQFPVGVLIHEIGHALDAITQPSGKGPMNVQKPFADAFAAEAANLPKYFRAQHEFFAEVFARFMLDPVGTQRQFPNASKAFKDAFKNVQVPDTAALEKLSAAMVGSVPAKILSGGSELDALKEVRQIEGLMQVRLSTGQQLQPYVVTLTTDDVATGVEVAAGLASEMRTVRAPDAARYLPDAALLNVSASVFNDRKAFEELLQSRASDRGGAMVCVSDLAGITASSVGFTVLEEFYTRMGGQFPLVLVGARGEQKKFADALPLVMRRDLEVQKFGSKELALQVEALAREEGFVVSEEAMAAIASITPGGSQADAAEIWRTVKNAQAKRLEKSFDAVISKPELVRLISSADISATPLQKKLTAQEKIDSLVGMKNAKAGIGGALQQITLDADFQKVGVQSGSPRRNILLLGEPGTGKTTLAELFTEALIEVNYLKNPKIVKVLVQDLLNGEPEENVRKLFEDNKGAVIFLDEMHQLADTEKGKRAFKAMIPYLGNKAYSDTPFIGAGYPTELNDLIREVDAGAQRRFTAVTCDNYDRQELGQIFDKMVADKGRVVEPGAREVALDKLEKMRRRMKHFGNAGSVETLIDQAFDKAYTRLAKLPSADRSRDVMRTLLIEDFEDPPPLSREDVWKEIDALEGFDEVKAQLRSMADGIEFDEQRGVDPMSSFEPYIVIHGPPGSGKTTLATILARFGNAYGLLPTADVVSVVGSDLQGRFQGQTAGDVRKFFDQAWGKTLFIDEISGLARAAGTYKDEAVKVMLSEMEKNRGSFFLVVADYKEKTKEFFDLDPGLPRRFGRHFQTAKLGASGSERLLHKLLEQQGFAIDDALSGIVTDAIAQFSENPNWASGGDVRKLANLLTSAQKSAAVVRVRAGEQIDGHVILPEAFEAAFAEFERQKALEAVKVDKRPDDGAASEIASASKAEEVSDSEDEVLSLSAADREVMEAIAQVDTQFGAEFNGNPAAQKAAESDPNSAYMKAIAAKLKTEPAKAVDLIVRVRQKVKRIVETQTQQMRFDYHCPFCGGVNSPSCAYINYPLDWKIQHSVKKPWAETITERREIEEDVIVEKSASDLAVSWR